MLSVISRQNTSRSAEDISRLFDVADLFHRRDLKQVSASVNCRFSLILSHLDRQRLRASLKQASASADLSLEMQSQTPNQSDTSVMRQTSPTNNVRLTILLLFVSCSFLVLTLPAVMINLILAKKWSSKSSTWNYPFYSSYDPLHSEAAFYYTIGRLLMIMNHSINFILYFVFGKRFRRDLKRLFFRD